VAREPHDLLVTLRAEDAFDLAGRLESVTAPTLIIGGDRDAWYGEGVFRETADALPFGHLVLLPGAGHAATVAHRHLGEQVDAFLGHR
jgi:pimeloyl-ACP methyl ester carboxylesterase